MSSSILKFVAKQARAAGSSGPAARTAAVRALAGKGLLGRGHGATQSFTSTPAGLKSVLADSVELPNAAETIGTFASEGRPLPNWAYLRNGDKDANTIFSAVEMEERLAKLRAHMSSAGLDAVLLTRCGPGLIIILILINRPSDRPIYSAPLNQLNPSNLLNPLTHRHTDPPTHRHTGPPTLEVSTTSTTSPALCTALSVGRTACSSPTTTVSPSPPISTTRSRGAARMATP